MRGIYAAVAAAGLVAACGGGGGSGSGGSGTSGPAPAPSPTATPTPAPTYSLLAALTGDQVFKTACAGQTNRTPPIAFPNTGFGDGIAFSYAAATDSYTLSANGRTYTYGPADRDPAAPATARAYVKTVAGFTERFSIGVPTVAGAALQYTAGFSLLAIGNTGEPVQYNCVYGVPTLVTDVPPTPQVTFPNVAVFGIGRVTGGAAPGSYDLRSSTATLTGDVTTGKVTLQLRLVGRLLGPSGPSATTTELGTYASTADTDTAKPSYYGTIASSDRMNVFSQFGGWFFGPQGREAQMTYTIVSRNPADANAELVAFGPIAATR